MTFGSCSNDRRAIHDFMQNSSQHVRQRRPLLRIILFLALSGTLILCFFRVPLQNRITEAGVLLNGSPPPELVEETILKSADPRAALLAAWNSGKIVHREVAIHTLPKVTLTGQPLPPQFVDLLISGTLDPDMNVRETAFGILRERHDPRLAALAAGQFSDPDQSVRLLGLDQFNFVSPAIAVPTIIPLLDDSNPLVVIKSLNLLDNLIGGKFGVKFTEVATLDETKTGADQFKAGGREKVAAAVQKSKTWFAQHRDEFSPAKLQMPEVASTAKPLLSAPDFELSTVDGKKVRFSDFRGKVLLINFWTTWCSACVSEMPELTALQNKFKDKVAIVGVSLDFVPDDDEPPDAKKSTAAAAREIHDKIVRIIQARGINYLVLFDMQNEVGGYFNGGELPTTVIVDAQGNIRRRFIGARSLPEFEAILAEAGANPLEEFQHQKPMK